MTAYPDLRDYCEIAAELLGTTPEQIEHLARNHPLPDGNKRAAFLTLWLFMELNGRPFTADAPDIDTPIVERIAAGATPTTEIVAWLEQRTAPS